MHNQPDLGDMEYVIKRCINVRTVGDIRDLLEDGNINPLLKEIIENVEIELSHPMAKERNVGNITLKDYKVILEDKFWDK